MTWSLPVRTALALFSLVVLTSCATFNYEHGPQAARDTAQLMFDEYSAAYVWYEALPPERKADYYDLLSEAYRMTILMQRAALAWSINEEPPAEYAGVLAQTLELVETLQAARGALDDG